MIHEIDVLDGFKMIPDKSQDLIIVDPPYYKAINEKWDKQWKTEQEYLEWCKLWFNECVRVLKDTGSFYCYGNFDILSKQKVLIFDKKLNFRQNITLSKGLKSIAGRTSDKLRMFPTASEYLLFYVKIDLGGNSFYSDNVLFKPIIEYLRAEFKEASKNGYKTKHFREWMGLNVNGGGIRYFAEKVWIFPKEEHYISFQKSGRFKMKYCDLIDWYKEIKKDVFFTFNLPTGQTDVWDFTPDKVRYGHPTQKPKDICYRIIKASSNEKDNVLIPFAGSGSECVACDDLNRNWIAFENDKDNFSMSKKRVEKNKRKRLEELNFDKALN
jgi:DNA modification methylase